MGTGVLGGGSTGVKLMEDSGNAAGGVEGGQGVAQGPQTGQAAEDRLYLVATLGPSNSCAQPPPHLLSKVTQKKPGGVALQH